MISPSTGREHCRLIPAVCDVRHFAGHRLEHDVMVGKERFNWQILIGGAVGCVLIIVSILLRVGPLMDRPIWFDEAFSWTLATEFTPSEIIRRTSDDVHPPLYYLVLQVWVQVFGESLTAMRGLSVSLGTLTVIAAFLLGMVADQTGGRNECGETEATPGIARAYVSGLIFAGLIGLSAFQIHWSTEVRMYALLSFLFMLSTLFAVLAVSRSPDGVGWWAAFAVTSAAMLYTHNYGLFSFVALAMFLALAVTLREHRRGRGWLTRPVVMCLGSLMLAGVLYLPWVPILLAQKAQVAEDYWMTKFTCSSLAVAWDHLFVPEEAWGPWQSVRGAVFLSVVVGCCLLLQYRGGLFDRLCLFLTVVPFGLAVLLSITGASSIIRDRVFILIHLAALLTVTRAVTRWFNPLPALLLGSLLMVDGWWVYHRYVPRLDISARQGARAAMQRIEADDGPSVPVIVVQPCIYFSLKYHATDRSRVLLYTSPENIRHYTGGPILREQEFHVIDRLNELSGDDIWIATSSGYTAGFREPLLPRNWRAGDSEEFPAAWHFEGRIRLTRYERVTASD
ncbi:MAG: hypothetical protein RIK87_00765 [Fuerstiella sp.]